MATIKGKSSQNASKSPLITKFLTRINNKDKAVPNRKKLTERKTLSVLQPSADDKQLARPGHNKENTVIRKKKRKIGDVDGDENSDQQAKSPRIDHTARHFKIYVEPETQDDIPHSVTKKPEKKEKSSQLESKSDPSSADSSVECTCKCHQTQAPSSHTTEIHGDGKSQPEVKEKTPEEEAHDLMVKEEISEDYWKDLAEERRKALDESLVENEQLHTKVKELEDENSKLTEMASQAEYFASMLKMLTEEDQEAEGEAKDDGGAVDANVSIASEAE